MNEIKPTRESVDAAEKVLQQALVTNYERSGIETRTGTLAGALAEATIEVREQGGETRLEVALPDRERPSRWQGDKPVSVRRYAPIVFGGRPGIETTTRPMVFRDPHTGQVRRTHRVGPAAAHDLSLTEQQVREVGNALGQGIAASFEKAVSDRFK